jgi:uncharacterized protein (TIGR03435 family)
MMLRTLLEGRFHLRVRHEPRQESVWNSALAKSRPNMPIQDPEDKDCPADPRTEQRRAPHPPGPNVSMDSFVRDPTRVVGRTVIDKTDLAARYDLDVIFRGESARSGR